MGKWKMLMLKMISFLEVRWFSFVVFELVSTCC